MFFRNFLCTAFLLPALIAVPDLAYTQTTNSVVIWPINPSISADERATLLRLENPGQQPTLLQIRIFGWQQSDGDDRYTEQKEITGTPPMVRIEAGQTQIIRLTRTVAPPERGERAYRIVIDEIPLEENLAPAAGTQPEAQGLAGAAIRFRMRYSLPLFVSAAPPPRSAGNASNAPVLEWRSVTSGTQNYIEVRNLGSDHARLSEITLKDGNGSSVPLENVHGYVLPQSTMRWPTPRPIPPQAGLTASLDGNRTVTLRAWRP